MSRKQISDLCTQGSGRSEQFDRALDLSGCGDGTGRLFFSYTRIRCGRVSPGNNRKKNDTVLFFPSGTILKFFLMTHLSHVGRVAFFCEQILNFTIASIYEQRG